MFRTHAGLIPFQSNKYLDKSATAHAKYIIGNQRTGHNEQKGRYGYTGRTPDQRIRNAGYGSSFIMENISINTKTQHEAIDTLFSAVYHRFVFLNLERDEIGMGQAKTSKKRKILNAYVYDFGSSSVVKMCRKMYRLKPATYYTKHVCKKNKIMIPWNTFESKKNMMRRKNASIVRYPYHEQKNVSPAFYNESPDPLPGYKVSGYPISVQINPAYYKKVKLYSFKLYDKNGKSFKHVKIIDKKNDRNHLFNAYEYALMPLKRLAYASKYTAIFDVSLDGIRKQIKWSFYTKTFQKKVYDITDNITKLTVKRGADIILYIVPKNRKDILKGYSSKGGLKVSFLDPNTLKVQLPKKASKGRVRLYLSNKKRIIFTIE